MLYTVISVAANVLGAILAGVQFARVLAVIGREKPTQQDVPFWFSTALLACAIPFVTPVSDKLGATAALFIALAAVTTLVVSRSTK